jgi:hypothetical protein
MFVASVVIVQGIGELRRALSTGGRAVLLSPPGFALTAGCGFWRALIALGHNEFPGQIEADILDCASAPGHAMAALRAGCKHIVMAPASPAFPAVSSAAAGIGAVVLPERPFAVDF